MTIHKLFPTNVYQLQVPNNERLKELLIPKIEKYKDQTKPPDTWFTIKYKGTFTRDNVNEEINNDVFSNSEIAEQYEQLINSCIHAKHYQVKSNGMWFNYYSHGEYQERHNHIGQHHFACVHFLQYDAKIHSPLVFTDPYDTRQLHIDFESQLTTGFYNPKTKLNVKEGDFLIFPAYLDHEVPPVRVPHPEYPRITISMNIQFTDYYYS